jgi:hypothetical protein
MKRLLLISLLTLSLPSCRNASPESNAVTTAAVQSTTTTVSTTIATATTAPAAPAAPKVTGPKLLPVDEASSDPSLVAFRDELLAAVRRRDTKAVAAMADPKIRTSFGAGGGADAFRNALEQPGMWEDFELLLTQGGKFVGEGPERSFWAPYVYSAWPEEKDAFEFLAITGENVPLHESADAASAVIATLSHDIVGREGQPRRDGGAWQHVKTADGHTGWVETRSVRSPIGYRAGFLKSGGKWKLNALVAGD